MKKLLFYILLLFYKTVFSEDVVCYSHSIFSFSPSVFISNSGHAIEYTRNGIDFVRGFLAMKNGPNYVSDLKKLLNKSLFEKLSEERSLQETVQHAGPPISGIVPGSSVLISFRDQYFFVCLLTNHDEKFWIGVKSLKLVSENIINDTELFVLEETSGWFYIDINQELVEKYRGWIEEENRKGVDP